MGTTSSSETRTMADYLRSARTQSQHEVDEHAKQHEPHPATERRTYVEGR